jgi:hypothetical protein
MEGYMTATTSRRAVLAGVAAVPALSLPAIALGYEPDAKLLALGREFEAKDAEVKQANKRLHEADDRYQAVRPVRPVMPEPPQWYLGAIRSLTVSQATVIPEDHPIKVWERENEEHRRVMLDAYDAEWDKAGKESGYEEAEAEWEGLLDELWAIGKAIFALPAHTPAGLLLKVRVAEGLEIEPDSDDGITKAWNSLVGDIRAKAVQS